MKKSAQQYSGKLAEPLPELTLEEFLGYRVSDETKGLMHEKMALLLDHFGISKDSDDRWFSLALSLAIRHVPGFRYHSPKKRSKQAKWRGYRSWELYTDVMQLVQQGQS